MASPERSANGEPKVGAGRALAFCAMAAECPGPTGENNICASPEDTQDTYKFRQQLEYGLAAATRQSDQQETTPVYDQLSTEFDEITSDAGIYRVGHEDGSPENTPEMPGNVLPFRRRDGTVPYEDSQPVGPDAS